jgi:hypothetical protein
LLEYQWLFNNHWRFASLLAFKKQNSITLPSTEPEYVAMSSATSEIKFVTSVLEEVLGKPPPLPVVISKSFEFGKVRF